MQAADGTDLFVQDWPAIAPRRGSALIVHGLGEHSGRYAHVAAALNRVGVAVRSYDQRGFGRSGGERGAIPSRNALVDDAKLVFDALAEEARAVGDAALPFLIGHSMGGAIAARAVTGGWIAPRGLVLSSPALRTGLPGYMRALIALGGRLVPNLAQPHGLPLLKISRDPQVYAEVQRDPLCHDRATPRLIAFILDAGAGARRDAARLGVPTLFLIAGDDRLVDAEGAREFADAIPSEHRTLHWYDALYHEVFNELEPDRSRVLDDLCTWIVQQMDRKPAS
jgi:alpha-beta hydrolase superfamily lysophospholipase